MVLEALGEKEDVFTLGTCHFTSIDINIVSVLT